MGERAHNPLVKPFLATAWFKLPFFVVIFVITVVLCSVPQPAKAGFFSNILLKFLTGENSESTTELYQASISMPLLGSQNSLPQGVGGPADDSLTPLVFSQDNSLVASRNPAGTLPPVYKDQILIYVVEEGDTPGSIAQSFDITLNTLLWANNISNPNLIKIGDELVILPVSGVKYEIRKGDSIESIAKKFRGDAGEILSFNGLAINEPLEIGSVIIIPDGEIAAPSLPTGSQRFTGLPEHKGYYMRPVLGGRRSRGLHGFNGVDLASWRGDSIFAAAEGTVVVARSSGWNGGYGKYVVISHPNNTQTLYAHLGQVLVEAGQRITQGTTVGLIGSTGNSTGPHLHFEIRGAKNPF